MSTPLPAYIGGSRCNAILPVPPSQSAQADAPSTTQHSTGEFSVLSWNTLAQDYARYSTYSYTAYEALSSAARRKLWQEYLTSMDSDILCLQEVDDHAFLTTFLEGRGYEVFFAKRSGSKKDGCLTAWKRSKFRLFGPVPQTVEDARTAPAEPLTDAPPSAADSDELPPSGPGAVSPPPVAACGPGEFACKRVVLFNQIIRRPSVQQQDVERLQKDNVGSITVLEALHSGDTPPPPTPRLLVVANAHLFWNPYFEDVKLRQIFHLLEEVSLARQFVAKQLLNTSALVSSDQQLPPVVICTDLNSTPRSSIYRFVVTGSYTFGDHPSDQLVPLVPLVPETGAAPVPAAAADPVESKTEPPKGGPKFLVESSLTSLSKGLRVLGFDSVTFPSHGYRPQPQKSYFEDKAQWLKQKQQVQQQQKEQQQQEQLQEQEAPQPSADSAAAPSEDGAEVDKVAAARKARKDQKKMRKQLGEIRKQHQQSLEQKQKEDVEGTDRPSNFDGSNPAADTDPFDRVLRQARQEHRILVTQNRTLTRRKECPQYLFVPPRATPQEVLAVLGKHFNITVDRDSFYTRCPTCWGRFEVLPLEEARQLPFVNPKYHSGLTSKGEPLTFTRCTNCRRVRWWGVTKKESRIRQYTKVLNALKKVGADQTMPQIFMPGFKWQEQKIKEMKFTIKLGSPNGSPKAGPAAAPDDPIVIPSLNYFKHGDTVEGDPLVPSDAAAPSVPPQASNPLTLAEFMFGNMPVLHMQHALPLASAYRDYRALLEGKEVPPIDSVRSGQLEPEFTNFTQHFIDTLDYIFYTEPSAARSTSSDAAAPVNAPPSSGPAVPQLVRAALHELPPRPFASAETALPSTQWPSDHCLLQAHFRWSS